MVVFELSLSQTITMKLLTAAFFGSVFMFLGVALGALGSHALSGKITQEALQSYMISIRYMLFHGLALFFLSAFPLLKCPKKSVLPYCWSLGYLCFLEVFYSCLQKPFMD